MDNLHRFGHSRESFGFSAMTFQHDGHNASFAIGASSCAGAGSEGLPEHPLLEPPPDDRY